MILGIGSDIIDIRRIEKTLERFGSRFTERLFTETERRKSEARAGRLRNQGPATFAVVESRREHANRVARTSGRATRWERPSARTTPCRR